MPLKLCKCSGFYHRGVYRSHCNSWTHKLYTVLKQDAAPEARKLCDQRIFRFQNQFCNEGLIEDFETNSTVSTTMPKDIV